MIVYLKIAGVSLFFAASMVLAAIAFRGHSDLWCWAFLGGIVGTLLVGWLTLRKQVWKDVK